MSKKILTILIIIIIVILLALGIFWFLQGRNGQTEGKTSFRDFFPFGRSPDSEEFFVPETPIDQNDLAEQNVLPRLRQIAQTPTAGGFVFKEGGNVLIRYTDKATGHTYEANTGNADIVRISNTTMPKIVEAVWTGSDSVVLRFLREDRETIESVALRLVPPDEIEIIEFDLDLVEGDSGIQVLNLQKTLNLDTETQIALSGAGSPGNETQFFGPATAAAVRKFQEKYTDEILEPQGLAQGTGVVDALTRDKLNEITGADKPPISEEDENLYETILTYLPLDIKELAYIEGLGKIFYLEEDSLGGIGTLAETDGRQASQIFESEAKEWLPRDGGNRIILQTKASGNFEGLALSLSQNGNLEKILGGISGLVLSASPLNNDNIVFAESQGRAFSFNFYDSASNQTTKLAQTTLPEKCVWSKLEAEIIYCGVPSQIPNGDYPDSWYQGEVSFVDDIWKIDTETGNGTLLQSLPVGIDVISLSLSPDDEYLFFTNKKDYSLWSFKILEEEITVEDEIAEGEE